MMELTPAQRTMLLQLCDPFLWTSINCVQIKPESVLLNKEVHLLNHDGEEDDLPIVWKCGTFSIKPKKVPCKSSVNPLDSPVKLPTLSLYATRHSKGTLQCHNNKPIREGFELIKTLFTLCFSSPWEIPESPRTGLAMSTFSTKDWENYYRGGISSPQSNGDFSFLSQPRTGAGEGKSSASKHPSHHKIKPVASNQFKISSASEQAATTMEVERTQLITSFLFCCKSMHILIGFGGSGLSARLGTAQQPFKTDLDQQHEEQWTWHMGPATHSAHGSDHQSPNPLVPTP